MTREKRPCIGATPSLYQTQKANPPNNPLSACPIKRSTQFYVLRESNCLDTKPDQFHPTSSRLINEIPSQNVLSTKFPTLLTDYIAHLAHPIHSRLLTKDSNRSQIFDDLIVDLCLVSRIAPSDMKRVLKTSYDHIKELKAANAFWVTPDQDDSIRTTLEYLRNIAITTECSSSAKLSIATAILGLEQVLSERFNNHIYNFSYVCKMV